jgi:hypothetical protein
MRPSFDISIFYQALPPVHIISEFLLIRETLTIKKQFGCRRRSFFIANKSINNYYYNYNSYNKMVFADSVNVARRLSSKAENDLVQENFVSKYWM